MKKQLKNTKVVVLAGGKGTRFRPFSFVIPKPLMPIGEEPILKHLIESFKKYEISNFIISTGYQSELVKAYFSDGKKFGVSIDYFHEETPLGTAGPISLIKDTLSKEEYFFLINGDIYTELNFEKMFSFGIKNQFDILVGYVEKKEKNKFGVLEIDNGNLNKIIEKPDNIFNISSGIYLLNKSVLDYIPYNKFFTMPEIINKLLLENMKVGAFKIEEYWLGIENADDLDAVTKRLGIDK